MATLMVGATDSDMPWEVGLKENKLMKNWVDADPPPTLIEFSIIFI